MITRSRLVWRSGSNIGRDAGWVFSWFSSIASYKFRNSTPIKPWQFSSRSIQFVINHSYHLTLNSVHSAILKPQDWIVSIAVVCAHSFKLAAVWLHASLFFGMLSRANCSYMFLGIALPSFCFIVTFYFNYFLPLNIFNEFSDVLLCTFSVRVAFFIGMVLIFDQILTLLLR